MKGGGIDEDMCELYIIQAGSGFVISRSYLDLLYFEAEVCSVKHG